jgi:sigma-B regulation protein RsbU (phosphoserine phosphatase)
LIEYLSIAMARARILVLDDDPSTLLHVRTALASAHDVETELPTDQADVIICSLSPVGLAMLNDAKSSASFVMTYAPGQESEIGRTLREGAFYCLPRPVDAQVVRAVVARCLEVSALRQTARGQAKRLDGELAEARKLQRAMLPPAEGRLGKSGVSVAVRCRPSAEVGGDVVDYAEALGGRAALLIADVAGHGIGAAMLTTVIKSAFTAAAAEAYDPAAMVRLLCKALAPFSPERFVTLIVARIDRDKRTIEYVNAGHPPGCIFHRGQIVGELTPTTALIMPGTPTGDIHATSLSLSDNAGVLLYTDGLTDARSADRSDRYGQARPRDELARYPGGGAALLDGILTSVDAFTARSQQPDDITLLTASIGLPGLA